MSAITRSGKTCYLAGLSGSAKLGRTAWRKCCRDNAIASEKRWHRRIPEALTIEFEKITSTASQ